MAYVEPVRTQRTVGAFAMEATAYATEATVTPATDQVALYDAFNPIEADASVIQLNRARSGLGRDGIATGRIIYNLNAKVFAYGSGTAASPPKWMDFLRLSGFKRINVASAGPAITLSTAASGGVLPAGDYSYAIATLTDAAWGTADSMTLLGATDTQAVTLNQKVTLDFTAAGAGKKTYIFRTKVGGSVFYYLGEVGAAVATYVDDTTLDTGLGWLAPTAAGVLYIPISDSFESATAKVWLNSYMHKLIGMRSVMDFRGTAGQPVECNIQAKGLYNAPAAEANPTIVANPGMPPKFESAACTITPVGAAAFTPILKDFSLNTGTQLVERLDANAAEAVIEVAILQQFDPHLIVQIGVNTAYPTATGPIADMDAGTLAELKFTIGTATGARIRVSGVHGQLSKAPTYGDVNGERTWNLDYVLTAINGDDWLTFFHY